MTQTITPAPPTRAEPRRARPARRWAAAGAAALAAAAVVTVVVLMPPKDPAAAGVVLTAADQLSDSTTVRGHASFDQPGDPATADIEWDGRSSRIVFQETDGVRTLTTTGGTIYEEFGGKTTTVKATATNSLAPFPRSARDVVRAVVTNNQVKQVADDHYRLTMTDATRQALSGVAKGELAWFDLDSPQDVNSVDIWVSGERLDRLSMTGSFGSSEMRYTDFGAPITITAPKK